MKTVRLAASMADIAATCPSEPLGPGSRYVVAADLRMGDGGKKDELAGSGKALFAILGRWYLQRGYTLVLNGDVEDLRGFWLKDILAAWPELYALFDAFAEQGRLRKILGERDLGLMRLMSYPYALIHGFRLDGERNSLLVLHGHQASPPYAGRDYLSDYIQHWMGSPYRPKPSGKEEEGRERLRAERRLYRAASRLSMAAIEGHTRRPLFESMTNRDSIRAEVERLMRDADAEPLSPCLFCPGRVVGARGLRFLELEGDSLRLVRWAKAKKGQAAGREAATSPPRAAPPSLELSPYQRQELRAASLAGILERVELLGRGQAP
jgi:hypothetical protein